jgi:hypothetical protein
VVAALCNAGGALHGSTCVSLAMRVSPPSANGASIVGVYAPALERSADAARASVIATTRQPDGKVVVDARLDLPALLEVLEPGAGRSAAGDLAVVVSAT